MSETWGRTRAAGHVAPSQAGLDPGRVSPGAGEQRRDRGVSVSHRLDAAPAGLRADVAAVSADGRARIHEDRAVSPPGSRGPRRDPPGPRRRGAARAGRSGDRHRSRSPTRPCGSAAGAWSGATPRTRTRRCTRSWNVGSIAIAPSRTCSDRRSGAAWSCWSAACWSRCRRMSSARATGDRGADSRGPSSCPSHASIGGIAPTGSASRSRRARSVDPRGSASHARIESSHFLIMGDSGTGKSALIRQMLTQIEARGETAIVYDPALEYTPQFYTPERGDAILNPLDARSPYWTPADEWRHEAETLTLATSLFPDRHHENAFFTEAPRRIFAHLLTLRPTPEQLAWWLCHEDEIDRRLAGTAYAAMIDRQAPAQRSGVLASLNMVADTLKLLPAERDTSRRWSAAAWANAWPHGWLFLTSTPETRPRLVPLTSLWLDTLVLRLMNQGQPRPHPHVVRARRTRQPAATAAAPHGHHGEPEIEQSRWCSASKGAASSRRATATTPRRCCRSRRPRSFSAPANRTRRSGSRTPSGTSKSNGCGRAARTRAAGSRATGWSARSSRW